MSFSHFFHVCEDFSKEVVHGVCGVVKSICHGAERIVKDVDIFDIKELEKSWGDKVRFIEDVGVAVYDAVTYGHKGPLFEIITSILLAYDELFPKQAGQEVAHIATNASGFVLGRYALGPMLIKQIATSIIKSILVRLGALAAADAGSFSVPFLGPAVLVLTIEGLMDKASKSNQRLQATFPSLYIKLKSDHLNMLFFLVEKPMEKYLNTIRYAKLFPMQFHQELLRIEKHKG